VAGARQRPVHIPHLGRAVAVACLGALAVLALTGLISLYLDRPIGFLTRDPGPAVSVDGCSWGFDCAAAGGLSNLGYLVWAVAATVCFLGAWLGDAAPRAWRSSPLLWGGALTTVLMLDDIFQIHEAGVYGIVPHGKWVVPGLYGALALALAVRFRWFLAAREAWLLVASGTMFALHVGFDEFVPGRHLLEDGFRFLGIVLWATFFVGAGLVAVKGRVTRGP
jgi:hypothetical protein